MTQEIILTKSEKKLKSHVTFEQIGSQNIVDISIYKLCGNTGYVSGDNEKNERKACAFCGSCPVCLDQIQRPGKTEADKHNGFEDRCEFHD